MTDQSNVVSGKPLVTLMAWAGVLLLDATVPTDPEDLRLFQAGQGFAGLEDTKTNLGISPEAVELLNALPRDPTLTGGMLQWEKPDTEEVYYFAFHSRSSRCAYHSKSLKLSESFKVIEGQYITIENDISDDTKREVEAMVEQQAKIDELTAAMRNGTVIDPREAFAMLASLMPSLDKCTNPDHDHSHEGIEHDPDDIEEPIEETGEHEILLSSASANEPVNEHEHAD